MPSSDLLFGEICCITEFGVFFLLKSVGVAIIGDDFDIRLEAVDDGGTSIFNCLPNVGPPLPPIPEVAEAELELAALIGMILAGESFRM